MATIYYDSDGNLEHLKGQTIAVIGYGSQGHAHALNAQDSGLDVVVGLRKGSTSWAEAEAEGLRVEEVAGAAAVGHDQDAGPGGGCRPAGVRIGSGGGWRSACGGNTDEREDGHMDEVRHGDGGIA